MGPLTNYLKYDLLKIADMYMIWMYTITYPWKMIKRAVVICRVSRSHSGGSRNFLGRYVEEAVTSRKPNKNQNVFGFYF